MERPFIDFKFIWQLFCYIELYTYKNLKELFKGKNLLLFGSFAWGSSKHECQVILLVKKIISLSLVISLDSTVNDYSSLL